MFSLKHDMKPKFSNQRHLAKFLTKGIWPLAQHASSSRILSITDYRVHPTQICFISYFHNVSNFNFSCLTPKCASSDFAVPVFLKSWKHYRVKSIGFCYTCSVSFFFARITWSISLIGCVVLNKPIYSTQHQNEADMPPLIIN